MRVVLYDLRDPFDIGVLSESERTRVSRFASADAARRWAAGRAGLRRVLAEATQRDPAALVLARGERGKPSLDGSSLRFNKSDSGELAAVALSESREVGLDVEQHRRVMRAERIARRFFSSSERHALEALPPEEQPRAFFECWTVKEAVLKCDGGGLGAIPMASYAAPFGADWRGTISGTWWGARLRIGEHASAAVVLAGTEAATIEITSRTEDASAPG